MCYKFEKVDEVNECQELIWNKIKEINNTKNPSYFQISTFIKVLGMQLKDLTNNKFLSSLNLLLLSSEKETASISKV